MTRYLRTIVRLCRLSEQMSQYKQPVYRDRSNLCITLRRRVDQEKKKLSAHQSSSMSSCGLLPSLQSPSPCVIHESSVVFSPELLCGCTAVLSRDILCKVFSCVSFSVLNVFRCLSVYKNKIITLSTLENLSLVNPFLDWVSRALCCSSLSINLSEYRISLQ